MIEVVLLSDGFHKPIQEAREWMMVADMVTVKLIVGWVCAVGAKGLLIDDSSARTLLI